MRTAALYWFYRAPELCLNHLRFAKVFNPQVPFYGLYGGAPHEAPRFAAAMAGELDDFHVFSQTRGADWKWRHGDQLIVDWYVHRGHALEWDTIALIQWDTLVCAPLDELFAGLRPGQMLLTGLRPLREVETNWWWTSPQAADNRAVYLRFLAHLRARHGYDREPMCCLFVAACIPRVFLDAYARIERPTLGFLEYKLPMYAQVFGVPLCAGDGVEPYWNAGPPGGRVEEHALNAVGYEIPLPTIARELDDVDGARLFHPVHRPVDVARRRRRG